MDALNSMTIVSLLLLALIVLGTYVASHRLSGWQMLVAITMLAAGIVLVVFPNAATYVAARLGVGRGTDLITYMAILGGLFVAANFYFRFKRQEAQMIEIVRELALRNPRRP
jgi:small membrane protein